MGAPEAPEVSGVRVGPSGEEAVFPGSAGRRARAGDPGFELIYTKLIQIRSLLALPCSRARPAGEQGPETRI